MSDLNWVEAKPGVASRVGSASQRFALALDSGISRHPWQSFALFSVAYFVIVFTLSSLKLLWLDELITLHISRLGTLRAIWHALAHGVDPNPPITYLLVHASARIFGNHEFAYRLPDAIGYWLGILSLFLYLRRRVPPTWALAGTVLSATMAAFDYSYESRSYAIFYGLAMLAVLCWSWTVDPVTSRGGKWISLAGMTFALAAGISTNYFAILAFLPLAAGEIARTIRREQDVAPDEDKGLGPVGYWRALDLRVWIALLVAALPLLVYLPLIQRSIAEFAPHAWNRVSWGQVNDSYTEMVEAMLYPALALFGFALLLRAMARRTKRICATCRARVLPRWMAPLAARSFDPLAVPFHEGVAVFFLMAYPILGYLVASIHGGMLSPRFVIPVCLGFAIAITLAAYQIFGQFRPAGAALLCFALVWLGCRESFVGYSYHQQKESFYRVVAAVAEAENSAPPGSPIVIPDPLMVLTFRQYAPPGIATRVVFPVDFPAIRFFRHNDSPDENLWAGRNLLYKVPIMPLAQFQNHAGEYLIVASGTNWLLGDLTLHHYALEKLAINIRAGSIGGFTPLARANPSLYLGFGGAIPRSDLAHLNMPVPFETASNVPQARAFTVPETVQ
ncbi:MAG TPA: glycosyltransferase family 39 protein [Terracidiphilus sp.]|nr:glycosyltransferase family 39 protein [Terracidiphilus sp.]